MSHSKNEPLAVAVQKDDVGEVTHQFAQFVEQVGWSGLFALAQIPHRAAQFLAAAFEPLTRGLDALRCLL